MRRSALAAAGAAAAAAQATVVATSPLVQWTGRVVRDEPAGRVSFDWESARALFTVTGATAVWATLNSTFWATPPARVAAANSNSNYYARALQQSTYPKFGVYRVDVDGVRQGAPSAGVVVAHGEAEYALASGLDASRSHTLSLWYTTDPVFNSWPDLDAGRGCMQVVAGLRTDGAFAPPPPPRTRSLLVVGDSISSGNAMLKPCGNASDCDSSRSYAALVGEAFQLNMTQLTVSSKGLVHNCCDKDAPVPVLMQRTYAQDATSQWDWASTPFDAVLINLGTNDGTQTPPADFTAAFLALMRATVRASPPGTPIFCAYGPITDTYAPWVAAAVAAGAREGLNATLVDLMAAPLDGCGHPGVLGHPAMARLLAPVIANVTGWPYVLP